MAIIDRKPKLRAKIGNTSLEFLDKDALFRVCKAYNGKAVTVSIDDFPMPVHPDLYAFYFGIIIRKECMNSEAFKTYYSEKEIHNMLATKLRTFIRARKGVTFRVEIEEVVEDVLSYDYDNFVEYVQDVVTYLESEFGIIVKDYETYHIDRHRLTRKA